VQRADLAIKTSIKLVRKQAGREFTLMFEIDRLDVIETPGCHTQHPSCAAQNSLSLPTQYIIPSRTILETVWPEGRLNYLQHANAKNSRSSDFSIEGLLPCATAASEKQTSAFAGSPRGLSLGRPEDYT